MSIMDDSQPLGLEEDASPEEVEQPNEPVTDGTSEEDAINWKQRYEDLRPHADRALSEAQQHREMIERLQDPETAAEEFARLGYEIPTEEPDDEELTPYEEIQRELAELKGFKTSFEQQREQEAQQQADYQHVTQALQGIEERLGYDLPDEVANHIGNTALFNRDDKGHPDVQGVYDRFQQAAKADQQRRVKKRRKAATPPGGTPGQTKVDLRDQDARRAEIARMLEEESTNEEE